MRSKKIMIVTAAMLASTTLAGVSFADNPTTATPTKATPTKATPPATSTATSTATSQTVMTPSSPSIPTTTTTTQSTPGGATGATGAAPAPSSTPVSTTTTTSAEDMSASSASSGSMSSSSSSPSSGESTTIYNRQRPSKALFITGAAVFVGSYVTTAAFAGANGPIADKDLYIPVVGPWINLADRSSDRKNNGRDSILIAGSGVLQGVGLALVVTSFLVPEKVAVARISAGNVQIQVAPQAGAGGGGLGAVGTF